MKRKPKQGLERLLKIKKLGKYIQRFSEDDLAEYEKTVLVGRTFSKIQKYLKCIRKTPTIPSTVKDGNTESSNEREKCELFNDYFVSVFGTKEHHTGIVFPKSELNRFIVDQSQISEIMSQLNVNKSMGHDNIGNLILKSCHKTLKQITYPYISKLP